MKLETAVQKGAITVPSIAVQRRPGGLFVFVAKPDNSVSAESVEVGQDDGQTAIVTKGLAEGTMVVVAGQSRLQPGSKIAATPSKPAS